MKRGKRLLLTYLLTYLLTDYPSKNCLKKIVSGSKKSNLTQKRFLIFVITDCKHYTKSQNVSCIRLF